MASALSKLFYITVLIITIFYQFSYFTTHVHSISNKDFYQWLKPGIYFKYILYNTDSPSIILKNGSSDKLISVDYLIVYWRVNSSNEQYFIIEYIVEYKSSEVDKVFVENNSLLTKVLLGVDAKTLDVYIVNESNKPVAWVGEWPYLISSSQLNKRGLKLLFIKKSDSPCVLYSSFFNESKLQYYLERINETIRELTRSTKHLRYEHVENELVLTNYFFGLIETNPPPNDFVFRLRNTEFSRDRIVYGKSYVSLHVSNNYIGIFNYIYNTSYRPMRFYTIESSVRNYTIMIDESGELYCMIPPFITRVVYDNVSGVLLQAQGMIDNILNIILGFKTLLSRYTVPYYPGVYERGCLELIDTNIDLSIVSSRENSFIKWCVIISLIIIIPTAAYFVIRLLIRKQKL